MDLILPLGIQSPENGLTTHPPGSNKNGWLKKRPISTRFSVRFGKKGRGLGLCGSYLVTWLKKTLMGGHFLKKPVITWRIIPVTMWLVKGVNQAIYN